MLEQAGILLFTVVLMCVLLISPVPWLVWFLLAFYAWTLMRQ